MIGALAILLCALWLIATVYVWLANLDDMDHPGRDFFACIVLVPVFGLWLLLGALAALVVAVWGKVRAWRC